MLRTAIAFTAILALAACVSSPEPRPLSAGRTVGAVIDDTSIKLALNRDLRNAFPGLVLPIGTEVREGRVLLAGTLPTQEQRDDAERIARQIRGVTDVINVVEVRESKSTNTHLTDGRITQQLRLRLTLDRSVHAGHFEIETVDSTVYILGTARDQRELERVAFLAATVVGVKKVVSHALLADDPRRSGAIQPREG